jgi:hypothetical protein
MSTPSSSYPLYQQPSTSQTAVSTISNTGRLIKQVTDQLFFHTVAAGTTYELFDDSQNGALEGFEITTDLPDVILQIYYYADNPTVINYVNNFQMHELLSLGRGLTPGEVAVLPNGQSQDIPGRPSSKFPYLARFKLDSIPDFTSQFVSNSNFNSSAPVIVLKYEPSPELAYKRIVGNIINTNSSEDATIITLDVKRAVFQDILPGDTPPPDPNINVSNVRRTVALPVSPTYGFPRKKPSVGVPEDPVYEPQSA